MLDFLTIGSAGRDLFLKSPLFRIVNDKKSPTGKSECFSLGSKIPIEEIYFTTGGAGTNAAVTFARQGFKVSCIVRVGNDNGGREVIRELDNEGIEHKYVQYDKKGQTAYSVILIAPSGERTILTHRGVNAKLSSKEVPWKELKPRWVYLNSLGGDFSIIEGTIRLKKAHGTFIAWNPGNLDLDKGLAKIGRYLKYIDVFIVNQEEASGLLGIPYNEEKQIFKKMEKVVPGLAIMTKGHDGLTVANGKHMWMAGVYKEKYVMDRTGAGDSFCSGFVSGLHYALKKKKKITNFKDEFTDADIEFAIKLGSANGTSKVEHMGAKGGLLYKKDLKDKRWEHLNIKKIKMD